MTRRALLLAGGATVLAGCGREDAAAPPPREVDALRRQLAAERAVVAAMEALDGPAPARRLRARAADRARRLAAAVSAAGGRSHEAPQPPTAGDALAAQRAALAAHVAALPDLRGERPLGVDLVTEAATDAALLAAALGEPAPDDAFPASGT